MKHCSHIIGSSPPIRFHLILSMVAFACASVQARTIYVLTDTHRALLCNSEAWLNPKTRIWFVPARAGYFGGAYVGYADGWARGGLNAEGLAGDWGEDSTRMGSQIPAASASGKIRPIACSNPAPRSERSSPFFESIPNPISPARKSWWPTGREHPQ